MIMFTWRDRFVGGKVVVGSEGGTDEVTVIWFGVSETLFVLQVALHLVPLTAGQIAALCSRREQRRLIYSLL